MSPSVSLISASTAAISAATSSKSRTGSADSSGSETKALTTDRATISEVALKKSSETGGGWKEKLISNANADPQEGDKWLSGYTSVTTDGPVLDISDPPLTKLSSTGEIYTPEIQQRYEKASKLVMQTRSDIYASEKSKGTPPSEIMEKLFAYNDSLPQWYKDGMNWT